MYTIARSFQQLAKNTNWSNIKKKEIKGIWIVKDEVKLSIFVYDIILYIRTPKNYDRKLDMINS